MVFDKCSMMRGLGGLAAACMFHIILLMAQAAQAGRSFEQLDETLVQSFIERASEVTSGQSGSDIQSFLERHLDGRGSFKSKITYIVPGFPEQEKNLDLDKRGFIDNVLEGAGSLSQYNSALQIHSIDIGGDGRQARVLTSSEETGLMAVPVEGGEIGAMQDVPVEGHSTCNQLVSLNDEGVIQIEQASCATRIEFKKEEQ